MPPAYLTGLGAGLALIVAIGAQNAYVLRQGLLRSHVGVVVAICVGADALLIAVGVAGVGAAAEAGPELVTILRWGGAAFLLWYALRALVRVGRAGSLAATGALAQSRREVMATISALTFLNPHVYLDTVLLLGSLASAAGDRRWWFWAGASTASGLWFATLGFGARGAAPLAARPGAWRLLDVVVAATMVAVAGSLVLSTS
jgi:L-lysine exporter family protein LysE/ArgO